VRVKVIKQHGAAALVEWFDGETAHRTVIPVATLQGEYAPVEELRRGIPWGEDWAALIELRATPESLAKELRRRGIWTEDDLRQHQEAALGAIQMVYGLDLATLLKNCANRGGYV